MLTVGVSKVSAVRAMRNQHQWIARLLSHLLHPWAVLFPVTALVAYQSSGALSECVKWTVVTLLPAYLLPSVYAQIKAMMLSPEGTRQRLSRSLFRDKPGQLLIMTSLFGVPVASILYYFDGPKNLLALVVAVTGTMLVTALLNVRYRASFHLAMVTSMLCALWVLFGAVSLATLPLVPILGLSRWSLGEHSPTQLITGFFLGLAVTAIVFHAFGLLV